MLKSKERKFTLLSDIRRICQHCAVSRAKEDLEIIHDFVTLNTDIIHDPFWKFLPRAQRIRLCSHFRHVRHETDTLIYLDGPEAELKLLVWGEAELASGHSIKSLNAKNEGPSLGSIRVPASIQRLIHHTSPNYDTFLKQSKTCDDFIKRTRLDYTSTPNKSRPSILMSKGSQCLYLNSLDLRPFMENLFDRLISHRILNHLHLTNLRKRAKFFTIPQGNPILIEGVPPDHVVVTLRGRCIIRKSLASIQCENSDGMLCNTDVLPESNSDSTNHDGGGGEENIHIGHVPPMSFLGFLQHFDNETHELTPARSGRKSLPSQEQIIRKNQKRPHPMTIIADTEVRCLVIPSPVFLACLQKVPAIHQIFRTIAKQQLQWLHHYLPNKLAMLLCEKQSNSIVPFPNSSMAELEELIKEALTKSPLLNKHRLLKKFKALVSGEYDGTGGGGNDDDASGR